MATHAYSKFYITPFWNDEYKHLDYIKEDFNDPELLTFWTLQGLKPRTGHMCDMRSPQPSWNYRFIQQFEKYGWRDVGTSYYRMDCGAHLPMHSDRYVKYINIFNLQGREHTIRRAVVFLEDSIMGHMAQCCNENFESWTAGMVVEWEYDAPHMAANFGHMPRYTLQITGHIDD